ncbi:hypothetical protein [Bartonella saheliensis]|uniref:hypothetical protein n=1 Tax=Bartonella saheliensis TaxID=1457016 RepID=UPI001FE70E5A|nr:hypothetical protein [Bartonella saheliensis]
MGEETNWYEEGARIGVLMREERKQREGGESVKMGENGMEGGVVTIREGGESEGERVRRGRGWFL